MKKLVVMIVMLAFVFGMAFVTLPGTAQAVSQPVVTTGSAKKIVFYGYVKFRMNYEDKNASLMGGCIPPSAIPEDDTTAGENGRINLNARETKFGLRIYGDSFNGWKTSGQLEFDMYGGGHNHHSEVLRMKIGQISLTKGNTKITMGKGYTLFGNAQYPFVENFMLMPGASWMRAVGVDIAQKFPSGDNTFGAEFQVMTYDDDNNGFNTENLGFPFVQGQLSLVSKTMGYAGGKPLGLWLGGIYGNMAEPDDIYTDGVKVRSGDDYDVYGVELYWYAPIISSKDRGKKAGNLAFSGRAYYGQALGATNSNLNYLSTYDYTVIKKPSGGYDEITGYGGYVGLSYWISNAVWTDVYFGYDGIDTENYYPGDIVEDSYGVTANIWWAPARSVMFGLEYMYVNNEFYKTDAYGNDNATLNSVAFVAYYFF